MVFRSSPKIGHIEQRVHQIQDFDMGIHMQDPYSIVKMKGGSLISKFPKWDIVRQRANEVEDPDLEIYMQGPLQN